MTKSSMDEEISVVAVQFWKNQTGKSKRRKQRPPKMLQQGARRNWSHVSPENANFERKTSRQGNASLGVHRRRNGEIKPAGGPARKEMCGRSNACGAKPKLSLAGKLNPYPHVQTTHRAGISGV
jgi:hypothetical protein